MIITVPASWVRCPTSTCCSGLTQEPWTAPFPSPPMSSLPYSPPSVFPKYSPNLHLCPWALLLSWFMPACSQIQRLQQPPLCSASSFALQPLRLILHSCGHSDNGKMQTRPQGTPRFKGLKVFHGFLLPSQGPS